MISVCEVDLVNTLVHNKIEHKRNSHKVASWPAIRHSTNAMTKVNSGATTVPKKMNTRDIERRIVRTKCFCDIGGVWAGFHKHSIMVETQLQMIFVRVRQ